MIELNFLSELHQVFKGQLILAGITDNKGGSEGRFRHPVPNGEKCFTDRIHLAGTVHGFKDSGIGVLERHVQIGNDLWLGSHQVNQRLGDITWEGVHQPDPGNIRNGFDKFFQQGGQAALYLQVMTVIGHILGDQDDLLGAHIGQRSGIIENQID